MEGRASDGMGLSSSPFASLIGAWSCFEMFLIQQNAIQAEARHIRITSGIGLSLSRQIMLAHNGRLDLVRSDSQCTRFTLLFR